MLDMKCCWCIIIALIVVLFTDSILNTLPIFKVLFTDSINYVLVMLLVVFIMLIDLQCGIVLGLVILYVSMYVNSHKNIIRITNEGSPLNNKVFNTIVNSNIVMPERKVKFAKENTIINPSLNPSLNSSLTNSDTILSDSEFIYNNTKPFPNNNLKPFQPNDSSSLDTNTNNINLVQQKINDGYKNDFITKVEEPDRSGYDVTGCRYDMKNSPQNLTKYGPPLAQCSAYNTKQAQTCGTVFYPLNA